MKKLSLIGIVAIFAFSWLGGEASTIAVPGEYITIATGGQEVPPVATSAFSIAPFEFSANDSALVGLRFNINHDQLVDQVHIHQGAFGVDGPIILNMRPANPGEGFCIDLFNGLLTYYILFEGALRGPLAGMTLTDLKEEMATSNTYLNLHTPENPGGWIRGQMIPR